MKNSQLIGIIALTLLLANCSSKPKKKEVAVVKTEEVKKEEEALKDLEKDVKQTEEIKEAEIAELSEEPAVFLDEDLELFEDDAALAQTLPAAGVIVDQNQVIVQQPASSMQTSTYSSSPYNNQVVVSQQPAAREIINENVVIHENSQPVQLDAVVVQEADRVDSQVIELDLDEPAVDSYEVVQEASSVSFSNGMRVFSSTCNMRAGASKSASILGTINRGKKLWVDNYSSGWAKVYRKAGPAYVSKKCL